MELSLVGCGLLFAEPSLCFAMALRRMRIMITKKIKIKNEASLFLFLKKSLLAYRFPYGETLNLVGCILISKLGDMMPVRFRGC